MCGLYCYGLASHRAAALVEPPNVLPSASLGWGRNRNGGLALADTAEGVVVAAPAAMGDAGLHATTAASEGVVAVLQTGEYDRLSTFWLTRSGRVWAAGSNKYAQLCRNGCGLVSMGDTAGCDPETIGGGLAGKRVARLFGAANHVHFITTGGELWSCGYNYYGEQAVAYGVGGDAPGPSTSGPVQGRVGTPTLVDGCAGLYHVLGLTDAGEVYVWGSNDEHQLGISGGDQTNGAVLLNTQPQGVAASSVHCGWDTSAFITAEGSVYGFGNNHYDVLGSAPVQSGSAVATPQPLSLAGSDARAASMCFGNFHSVVLTTAGGLQSSGHNSEGQLGLGDINNRADFAEVDMSFLDHAAGEVVRSVHCGREHTALLTSHGRMCACGGGSQGALGFPLGSSTGVNEFQCVGGLDDPDGQRFFRAVTASQFSANGAALDAGSLSTYSVTQGFDSTLTVSGRDLLQGAADASSIRCRIDGVVSSPVDAASESQLHCVCHAAVPAGIHELILSYDFGATFTNSMLFFRVVPATVAPSTVTHGFASPIVLHGASFDALWFPGDASVVRCRFGDGGAELVPTSVTPSAITCELPPSTDAGEQGVFLSFDSGASWRASGAAVTVVPTTLTPLRVNQGIATTVFLVGQAFDNLYSAPDDVVCRFGAYTSTPTRLSPVELACVVDGRLPQGSVYMEVSFDGGSNFTAIAPPIDVLSVIVHPNLVVAGLSTLIQINGTGFDELASDEILAVLCRFGDAAVSPDPVVPRSVSNETIVCATPASLVEGSHEVWLSFSAGARFEAVGTAVDVVVISAPSAPTGLAGDNSQLSATSLAISWDKAEPNGAPVLEYSAQWSRAAGFWATEHPMLNTSLVLRGLHPGTVYQFRVAARNAEGWSEFSPPISLTTLAAAPDPVENILVDPSRLTATSITFRWTPPSDNGEPITEYVVRSNSDGGSTWATYTGIPVNGTGAQEWVLDGLEPGSAHRAGAAAVNSIGTGAMLVFATAKTLTTVPSTPDMPIEVADGRSTSGFVVSWQQPDDNGAAIVECVVEVSKDTQQWARVAAVDASTTTLAVTELEPGTTYTVRVGCSNAVGASQWSPNGVARTLADRPAQPDAPSPSLRSLTQTSIPMTWALPAAHGSNITQCRLDASRDGGLTWEVRYEGPLQQATRSGLIPGEVVRFRVSCRNDVGWSVASETVDVATLPDVPEAPAAPETVDGTVTSTSMRVSWEPPRSNGRAIEAFRLSLSVGAGSLAWQDVLETFEVDDRVYTASDLRPGTVYRWRVTARNAIGWSEPSEALTVATVAGAPEPPGAPVQIEARRRSLTVAWQPPPEGSSAVDTYRAEVSVDGGASWFVAYEGNLTTVDIEGLSPGVTVHVEVQAHNERGYSDPSEVLVTRTLADRPQTPAAPTANRAPESRQLCVAWVLPADNGAAITRTLLESSAGNEGSWGVVAELDVTRDNSTSFERCIGGLTPGVDYGIRTIARNEFGESAPSATLVLTTAPAPPGQPAPPQATAIGLSFLDLAWSPPASNGLPIDSYLVRVAVAQQSEADRRSGGSAAPDRLVPVEGAQKVTIDSLPAGTGFNLSVSAHNGRGSSAWSVSSLIYTTTAAPEQTGAPTLLGVPGTRTVTFGWSPPEPNGEPLLSCRLDVQNGGRGDSALNSSWAVAEEGLPGHSTFHVLGGASPGTWYRVRVACANRMGWGAVSGPSAWVRTASGPPEAPAPPTIVEHWRTSVRVVLGAVDDNGEEVDRMQVDYAVASLPERHWVLAADHIDAADALTGVSVSYLTPQTSYVARTRAHNANGWGAFSAASEVFETDDPCPMGTYALGDLFPCVACPLGTEPHVTGDVSTNNCRACPAGTFRGDNMTHCTPCPVGFVARAESSSCRPCQPKHVPNALNATCIRCQADAVARPGQQRCVQCGAGFEADHSGDRCVACRPGWAAETGVPCQQCRVGRYSASPNATECDRCPPGTFQDESGRDECRVPSLGWVTAGASADGFGATAQLPCPAGSYATSEGACAPCDSGFVSEREGSQRCTACPTGTAASASNQTCLRCPLGFMSLGTTRQCTRCAPNTQPDSIGATCVPCPFGTHGVDGINCLPCGPGEAAAGSLADPTCAPCAPGTFSDVVRATACQSCPPGTVAERAGAVSCASCGAGLTASADATACVVQLGFVALQADAGGDAPVATESCEDLEGADCTHENTTLASLPLHEGYWRASAASLDIRECEPLEFCRGGALPPSTSVPPALLGNATVSELAAADALCRGGHSGPLCQLCVDGYYHSGSERVCEPCPDSSKVRVSIITGSAMICVVLLGIVFCTTQRRARKRRKRAMTLGTSAAPPRLEKPSKGSPVRAARPKATSPLSPGVSRRTQRAPSEAVRGTAAAIWHTGLLLRVFIGFAQLSGEMLEAVEEQHPEVLEKLRVWFNVVHFDLLMMVEQSACVVRYSLYDSLMVTTLVPIGLIVLVGLGLVVAAERTHALATRRRTVYGADSSCCVCSTPEKRAWWRAQLDSLLMLILFLAVPTASNRIFSVLRSCDRIDAEPQPIWFLHADYSLRCDTEAHDKYTSFATAMMFVFAVTVPTALFVALWRVRAHINPPEQSVVDFEKPVGRQQLCRSGPAAFVAVGRAISDCGRGVRRFRAWARVDAPRELSRVFAKRDQDPAIRHVMFLFTAYKVRAATVLPAAAARRRSSPLPMLRSHLRRCVRCVQPAAPVLLLGSAGNGQEDSARRLDRAAGRRGQPPVAGRARVARVAVYLHPRQAVALSGAQRRVHHGQHADLLPGVLRGAGLGQRRHVPPGALRCVRWLGGLHLRGAGLHHHAQVPAPVGGGGAQARHVLWR